MRVLAGLQTSGNGELHIGNYLGAVRQWIELQEQHEAYYMLANLHAITVPLEPKVARENVYKIAALVLALGVDPNKSTLFIQSLVPAHAELAWLLNTIASMGEMRRMTQFKDKASQQAERTKGMLDVANAGIAQRTTVMMEELTGDSVSVGLFDYPVLMAADILLYQPQLIPVGDDQKQHLELTRNLAERFNNRFGQTFTLPEPYISADAARIMSLDNPAKKMSKSLGPDSYIGLLDSPETIQGKLKRAVTDSDNEVRFDPKTKPAISNLLTIFSAVSGKTTEALVSEYATAGYGRFKSDLAEALISFLAPIQAKYQQLIADQAELEKILGDGSQNAEATAKPTLRQAKDRIGVI